MNNYLGAEHRLCICRDGEQEMPLGRAIAHGDWRYANFQIGMVYRVPGSTMSILNHRTIKHEIDE